MPITLTSTFVNAVRSGLTPLRFTPGKMEVYHVSATFNGSTVTPGAVFQMVPIPTGARVYDVRVWSEWIGNAAGVFSVGDGSLTNRYVTSASLTASSRLTLANAGLGFKYSVSDDAIFRWDTIDLNVGAGATQCVTGSIMMTVWFKYEDETTN